MQSGTYTHSPYKHFVIFDNKKRDIYKAEVRDRIVHQIVYDRLLCVYNPIFISDSYASRKYKGQHKAVKAFRYFVKLASSSDGHCRVLKCDLKKYFDNIDQHILFRIIKRETDLHAELFEAIRKIIFSYSFSYPGKGIPLGNVTSQIFANIYLNILDQYVKNELKCRYYVRYNDDIVIASGNIKELVDVRDKIIKFVRDELLLEIPIAKTSIRKIGWGVDFLGYNILTRVALLRDKTKHKIYSNIDEKNIHSYMSILKHCSSYNLKNKILSKIVVIL